MLFLLLHIEKRLFSEHGILCLTFRMKTNRHPIVDREIISMGVIECLGSNFLVLWATGYWCVLKIRYRAHLLS